MLHYLAKDFEIILYSAGVPKYVEAIKQILDPTGSVISYCLNRTHLNFYQHGETRFGLKDLTKLLGNRTLLDTLIVDNLPENIVQQLNLIPIHNFEGDLKDDTLI